MQITHISRTYTRQWYKIKYCWQEVNYANLL